MSFQERIIEKGEKYGLYACIGLTILLFLFGAYSAFSDGIDPEAKAKELQSNVQRITSAITNQAAEPNPLDSEFRKPFVIDTVAVAPNPHHPFDPIAQPDNKRTNPTMLAVQEIQTDVVLAKILSVDIRDLGDKVMVGVLRQNQKGQVQEEDRKKLFKNLGKKVKKGRPPQPANPGNGPGGAGGTEGLGGGPPGMGGMMGGPPGMGSGMKGGPPGMGSGMMGGPPGMGSGMKGGPAMGGMMGGPPGMGMTGGRGDSSSGYYDSGAQRMEVSYVPVEDEKALENKDLALTLYPKRFIVINASFPYRDLLEKFQKALKLNSVDELLAQPDLLPAFREIKLERAEMLPNGKLSEWHDIPWKEHFIDIYRRKVANQPEENNLEFVMLDRSNNLVLPLPEILDNQYPTIRMPMLRQTIDKFKAANKTPQPAKSANKLKGEGNIFGDDEFASGQGTNPGDFFGGINPAMANPGLKNLPGFMSGNNGPGNNMGVGNSGFIMNSVTDVPDYVLIRVVDSDPNLRAGVAYRYRIQLTIKNPNFGKKDLVSQPSDAEIKDIVGPWSTVDNVISLPRESFLYAVDPSTQEKKASDPKAKQAVSSLKPGQAMMQIQRWLPQIKIDTYKEPLGDWLVANTIVTEGTYFGSKELVEVPLWSSESKNFVIRKTMAIRDAKSKNPVRGVLVDTTRTDMIVADVEGGDSSMGSSANPNKKVTDSCDREILLISDDGSMVQVFSELAGTRNADRKKREDKWKNWINNTSDEARMDGGNAGNNDERFNR